MVGYTESYGSGNQDVMLVRTDAIGKVLWSKAYGGKGDETGWNVVNAADSGFVVVGTTNSYNNNNADALIFKTDKSGSLSWTLNISTDSVEDAYNVYASRNGSYYVTGFVRTDTTGDDAYVAKISSSGTLLWYRKYGSLGNEEGYGITEDLNNNIILCGMTTYDSITQGGTSGYSGNSDMFIARIRPNGDLHYMKTYGTTGNDVAWDIQVDGYDYVMTGWTESSSGDKEVAFLSVDSTGNINSQYAFGTFGEERGFNIMVNTGKKYTLARDIISV